MTNGQDIAHAYFDAVRSQGPDQLAAPFDFDAVAVLPRGTRLTGR